MSEIIIPDTEASAGEGQEEVLRYQATEEDEERFFLLYHFGFQPSEAERLSPDYRKWLIARFVAQKNLEREAVERHRLMHAIGPNLQSPNLRLHE